MCAFLFLSACTGLFHGENTFGKKRMFGPGSAWRFFDKVFLHLRWSEVGYSIGRAQWCSLPSDTRERAFVFSWRVRRADRSCLRVRSSRILKHVVQWAARSSQGASIKGSAPLSDTTREAVARKRSRVLSNAPHVQDGTLSREALVQH